MGSSRYWPVKTPQRLWRQPLTAATTRIWCRTPSKFLIGAQEARAKNRKEIGVRMWEDCKTNASNKPPRGELRDCPNDDQRTTVVSFEDPPPTPPAAQRESWVPRNRLETNPENDMPRVPGRWAPTRKPSMLVKDALRFEWHVGTKGVVGRRGRKNRRRTQERK